LGGSSSSSGSGSGSGSGSAAPPSPPAKPSLPKPTAASPLAALSSIASSGLRAIAAACAPGGIALPYSALLALRADILREVGGGAGGGALLQACAALGVEAEGLERALDARDAERVLECDAAAWRSMEPWRRRAVRRKALLFFPAPQQVAEQ
jgi:hypothetical protein